MTVNYRLRRLSGSVVTDWRNAGPSPGCQSLDACGSAGTTVLTPRAIRSESLEFSADGPVKRSYRDFLAALGLSRHGNRRGIVVSGLFGWLDGGSTTADVVQGGGTCRDSTKLTSSFIALGPRHGQLAAFYVPVSGASDPLRTRCPGPDLGNHAAAIGRASLQLLDKRTLTLRLVSPKPFKDRGYVVRLRSNLALTLTRTRITQLRY